MNDWFDPKTWMNPNKAVGAFNDLWKTMMWLPTDGRSAEDSGELKTLLEAHHKAISGIFENLALLNENNAKMVGDMKRVLSIVSELDRKTEALDERIERIESQLQPKKDSKAESSGKTGKGKKPGTPKSKE